MKTKKNLMVGALALMLVLVSATAVFADAEIPGNPGWGMGTPIDASLDAYMLPAMAEALHLSEDEVASALDSGTTFVTLAIAAGYDFDEAAVLLQSIQAQALELAVLDGVITQDQADWLQSVRYGVNGRGRMSGNSSAPRFYSTAGMRRAGRQ